jgi:C-terminal processing protease CtpA/Prc
MKKGIAILTLSALSLFIFGQTEQQINNQKIFAKLFGYVRYFYPGDEASAIDWDKFAVYGCSMVDKCKNQQELKAVLNKLFLPVVPSIKIFETKENTQFNAAEITPSDTSKRKTITWQHFGLGLPTDIYLRNNIYISARTNRPLSKEIRSAQPASSTNKAKHYLLFEKYALFGEFIDKEIGSGLSCIMPLALYGDDEYTYPLPDLVKLNTLKKNIRSVPDSSMSGDNLYVRLADIIISWNVFQHFYPYFDIAKTNWTDDLMIALTDAYHDKSAVDFLRTLQKLTAKLKDGHVEVRCTSVAEEYNYYLPFNWEWVENKLVITQIFSDTIQIHRGDIITRINGMAAEEYFKTIEERISAGTKEWMDFRAAVEALSGKENSDVKITLTNAVDSVINMNIKRTMFLTDFSKKWRESEKIKKISNNIYYINLDRTPDSIINRVMPELVKCKSIIFDLRGNPGANINFLISHLLTQNDTSKMWMRVPQIIYPDGENIVGYKPFGWELKPQTPHLDAKIIFIINGKAISYAESFMSFIEHYKLATIIGQPTAGTNGNINPFTMPGEYRITWTGMKVVKHDGSQHHGIGIQPTIFLSRTIKGVREGKDEFLDKAIELANQ